MSSNKKIKFFKKIAILLSIVWTIMTYVFYTYQMQNENTHILENTVDKTQTSLVQAKELIFFAFKQKIKIMEKNEGLDLQTDFSIRDFIQEVGHKHGNQIKIEGNYLEDDFQDINPEIKNTIIKSQITKKDQFISLKKQDKNRLFYIKPLISDDSCIKCHVHDDK